MGCGLDSRVLRINTTNKWYDVDFNSVITMDVDSIFKYYGIKLSDYPILTLEDVKKK